MGSHSGLEEQERKSQAELAILPCYLGTQAFEKRVEARVSMVLRLLRLSDIYQFGNLSPNLRANILSYVVTISLLMLAT